MSTHQFDSNTRLISSKASGGNRTWESTNDLRFFAHSPDDPAALQQHWKCIETGEFEWREVPMVTGSTMLNDNED